MFDEDAYGPEACEEVSHQAQDDDRPVRGYNVYDDDDDSVYPRWLCDACAEELETCGVRLKPHRTAPAPPPRESK